jgi:mitosis inhibitor protein kinase SWE1
MLSVFYLYSNRGEPWHRLRQENFEQVDLDSSPELLALIKSMMRTNAWERVSAEAVFGHAVVRRTRAAMERMEGEVRAKGGMVFLASPLASVPNGFLEEILGTRASDGGGCGPDRCGLMDDGEMDVSV